MVKAIIFDCFGVLASDGWLPYKARYFGQDAELMMRATLLNKAVDSGELSYDEFIAEVAKLANLSEGSAREQIENNIPDTKLFDYIRDLRRDYKIGMLSNAGANWLSEIFTPAQVALFDAVALSYEMGIIKPDSRVYETIAERLGVQLDECVFIDDQPRYVEGAERVGMIGVLYSNCVQLQKDLPGILSRSGV